MNKAENIFLNRLNSLNLAALAIFLIYFFSVTLLPIGSSVTSVRQSNLLVSQNKKTGFYSQTLKADITDSATRVTIATYINNGRMLARQIDNTSLQSYINGNNGSILKLNNSTSTNAQNYSYNAYGNIIENTTLKLLALQTVENPFQYNSERFDNNTALQYLRARFYNSETKRFLNQDSYNLMNRFNYADGNPVMKTDPNGHLSQDDSNKIVLLICWPFNIAVAALGLWLLKRTVVNHYLFKKALEREFTEKKILAQNDVVNIFIRVHALAGKYRQENSCLHESLLWALEYTQKEVGPKELVDMLSNDYPKNCAIIGEITPYEQKKVKATTDVIENLFIKNSLTAAILVTNEHAVFCVQRKNGLFFSAWQEGPSVSTFMTETNELITYDMVGWIRVNSQNSASSNYGTLNESRGRAP